MSYGRAHMGFVRFQTRATGDHMGTRVFHAPTNEPVISAHGYAFAMAGVVSRRRGAPYACARKVCTGLHPAAAFCIALSRRTL